MLLMLAATAQAQQQQARAAYSVGSVTAQPGTTATGVIAILVVDTVDLTLIVLQEKVGGLVSAISVFEIGRGKPKLPLVIVAKAIVDRLLQFRQRAVRHVHEPKQPLDFGGSLFPESGEGLERRFVGSGHCSRMQEKRIQRVRWPF